MSDATRAMVGGGRGFAISDPAHVTLKGLPGEPGGLTVRTHPSPKAIRDTPTPTDPHRRPRR